MISHYFSGDAAKVSDVVWDASDPGLSVTYRGRGENITGIITVGRYFVEHTTNRGLARRLLQLRHEIDHVEQQRAGMRGAGRSDEREFLAFHHEALSPEIPHTGRVSHSTRVSLIDAALGYYYCLDPQVRTQHASKRRELLQRRPGEVRSSGRASQIPAPPTSCRRQ